MPSFEHLFLILSMINYLKDLEHIKYTDWLLMSLLKFGQIHSDEKYWFHFHMTTRQTGNPRKHNFISDKFCFLTSNSLNTLLMKCWIFFCRSYPVSSHEILPHCRRCRARPCTRKLCTGGLQSWKARSVFWRDEEQNDSGADWDHPQPRPDKPGSVSN